MDLDLKDDWEVFDNKESISYTPKTTTLGQTIRIDNCLRRYMTKDFISGTSLHGEVAHWHLWLTQVPDGFVPQISDSFVTISDQPDQRFIPEQWVVLEVEEQTFRTRWRLLCQEAKA